MSRLIPHPLLFAGLLLMWLMLNRFSLGHLVLGTVIAGVAGLAMSALEPERPRIRRPLALMRLLMIVTWDILVSNLQTFRVILFGRRPGSQPEFVEIRLKLRDHTALAILAMIITAAPGTAWIEYDEANGMLLIHVLDSHENADWGDIVHNRYEALLMEIFE